MKQLRGICLSITMANLGVVLLFLASISSGAVSEADDGTSVINTAPGIIVMAPVSDGTQNHLRMGATFMVTGDLPSSTILATAILPTGEHIVLREFQAEACFVRYSYALPGPIPKTLTADSCGPTSYPLTGFDLPSTSLPADSTIEATVIPKHPVRTSVRQFRIRTTNTLRGFEQSADRLKLEIFGSFQSSDPVLIYFGLWPVPVRTDAVTVLADRVTVDLRQDQNARRWKTDLYQITVYQPGRVCDTVLGFFRSPLDLR